MHSIIVERCGKHCALLPVIEEELIKGNFTNFLNHLEKTIKAWLKLPFFAKFYNTTYK